MNISVYDTRKLYPTAYGEFSLEILDVNDNSPQFSQRAYAINVNTSAENAYSLIFSENAKDPDLGENASLTYVLIAGNELGLFYVENTNGRVWISRRALTKHDSISFYSLKLVCKDNGRPEFKYTTVDLHVKVASTEANRIETIYYYFEFDVARLHALNKLSLGRIPELAAQTLDLSSSDSVFGLDLDQDATLLVYATEKPVNQSIFVEKKVQLSAAKSLLIYVNPIGVRGSTSLKTVVFKVDEDFEWEYSVRQNLRRVKPRLVGTLTTTCPSTLTEFHVVNFRSDLFVLARNSNETTSRFQKLDVFATDRLDFEFEEAYEFRVVAKCAGEDQLWSKVVRVELVDLNDNQPRFVHPFADSQLISVDLNASVSENWRLLTTLRAVDADKSREFSALKYLLGSVEFEMNTCSETSPQLKLDQLNGGLYLNVTRGHSCDMLVAVTCMVYNYLDANYWASRVEIKFRLNIRINADEPTLQIQEFHVEYNDSGLIRQQVAHAESLGKCWVNELRVESADFYAGLHEGVFYFYEKTRVLARKSYFDIECQLLDRNNRASWLKLHVKRNYIQVSRVKSLLHVQISRQHLLNSGSFVARLENIQELSELNSDFVKETFEINPLNGALTTRNLNSANALTINSVDLITLVFNDLTRVHLHVYDQINSKNITKSSLIDNLHASIEGHLFEASVNSTITPQIVLRFLNASSVHLIETTRISLINNEDTREFNAFSIVNSSVLVFHADILQNFSSHLYLLNVNLCVRVTSEIYLSECRRANFNLKINFHTLNEVEAKFHTNIFTFRLVNFKNRYYMLENGVLTPKNVHEPFIDLKSLVQAQPLTMNVKFGAHGYSNSTFYVDENTGLVYASNLSQISSVTAFDVYLIQPDAIQSKAQIKIAYSQIPGDFHTRANLRKHALKPWSLLLRSPVSEITEVKCLNVDSRVCKHLFLVNNNELLVNNSLAYSHFYAYNLHAINSFEIQLNARIGQKLRVNINVRLDFELEYTPTLPPIRLFKDNDILNMSDYAKLVRVGNVATNMQLVNLDFAITNDTATKFVHVIFDVLNLKSAQLYAFEFDSHSVKQKRAYFMRLDYLCCEIVKVRTFLTFYDPQSVDLRLNTTQTATRPIFLLSQLINSKTKLDVNSYFTLNATTGRLKYALPVEAALNPDLFGTEMTMYAFAFLVDDSSLKTYEIIHYEVKIELTSRQTRVFEHKTLEFVKSELLCLDDETTAIYKSVSNNEKIEYELVYDDRTDLPFKVDRRTGDLYFLALVMKKFMFTHEIVFTFVVLGRDIYSGVKNTTFEISISNDDPLVELKTPIREFYVYENFAANQLVGSVATQLINDTDKLIHLKFEMDQNPHFYLDSRTGLLFSQSQINSKQQVFKLDVRITGMVGHRSVFILLDTFVILKNRIASQSVLNPTGFVTRDTVFYANESRTQVFEFKPSKAGRFKIIYEKAGRFCEANWFTSDLVCNVKALTEFSCKTKLFHVVNLIAYDLKNTLQIAEFIRIRIYVNETLCVTNSVPTNKTRMVRLHKEMKLNWAVFEDKLSLGHVYDMISDEHGFSVDSDSHRIHMTSNSSNFELDSTSSELMLVKRLDVNDFYLTLKIVDSAFQTEFLVFLELKITFDETRMPEYLTPYFLKENYTFLLEFATLKTWSNHNGLLRLGTLDAQLFKPTQLAKTPILLDSQQDYLTYLTESNVPSISIDSINGAVWANLSKIITQSQTEFDFTIVAINRANSDLRTQIPCTFRVTNATWFDLHALKFGYFTTNQIRIEEQVDPTKVKLNEEILNLSSIFETNELDYALELPINETDATFPFKLDSSTGQLILAREFKQTHSKIVRTYSFRVKLTQNLAMSVKISVVFPHVIVHANTVSEMVSFRVPNICTSSHFIGSLNNFFTYDEDETSPQTEYRFVLSDSASKNPILYLNETTGDLFCKKNSQHKLTQAIRFDVEIYAQMSSVKQFFFFKSVLLRVDLYESSPQTSYNEHLVYEMKLKETTRVETDVWTMPYAVNLRYDHCQIIAGNIYNTFYLNTASVGSLVLVSPLDYTLKSAYNLRVRCVNAESELDIELSIDVVKERFFPFVDHKKLLVFDSDVYEADFGNQSVLAKLNAFYPGSDSYLKNERVIYRFYNEDEFENEFMGQLKLDEHSGVVSAKKSRSVDSLSAFCESTNGKRTVLLRTINAFNRVDDASFATALLKIVVRCDSHEFQREARFSMPEYVTSVRENSPNGTRLSVNITLSSPDYVYFCNPNPNPTFVLDKSVVYVNSAFLDRETQSVYTYDLCTKSHKSKLTIKITDLNDNAPKIETFNYSTVELKLPFKFLSTQLTGPLSKRLFQLKATDLDAGVNAEMRFEARTASSNVFSLDRDSGWLYIRQMPKSLDEIHRITLTARDPNLVSEEVSILVSFADDKFEMLELNLPVESLALKTPVFSLKKHFPTIYSYLVINVANCETCFAYNQTTGDIIYSESSLAARLIEIKLISPESELKIADLYINFCDSHSEILNIESRPNKTEKFSILLSTRTAINTVVFKLDNTRLFPGDHTVFQVDPTYKSLLVRRNLTLLGPYLESIRLNLSPNVELTIYLLENLFTNFKFTQLIYYIERSAFSLNPNMGLFETSLTNVNMFNEEDHLIRVNSFSVTQSGRNLTHLFALSLSPQNKVQLDATNLTSLFSGSAILELKLELNFSTHLAHGESKCISTMIHVGLRDALKYKVLKSLDSLKSVYSAHLNLSDSSVNANVYTSISVYDLTAFDPNANSFTKRVQFKPVLAQSQEILDYRLNTINGILLVNMNKTGSTRAAFKAKFELVCFFLDPQTMEFVYLRSFYLNIFVNKRPQTPPVYFSQDYIQTRHDYGPTSSSLILDLKPYLVNFSPNCTFLTEDVEFLHLRTNAQLHLRAEMLRMDTVRLVNVTVCSTEYICDHSRVLIDIKVGPNGRTRVEMTTFELSHMIVKKNRVQILKLSHSGNYSDFKLCSNHSQNLNMSLNPQNGVLSLVPQNLQLDSTKLVYISVYYANRLQNTIRLTAQSAEKVEPRNSDLIVEFYVNTRNLRADLGYYVGNVGSHGVECELWTFHDSSDEFTYRLNPNCDLFFVIQIEQRVFSPLFHHTLQVRAYSRQAYTFFNVRVNLYELHAYSIFHVEFRGDFPESITLYNYLKTHLDLDLIALSFNSMTVISQQNLTLNTLQSRLRPIELDLRLVILSVKQLDSISQSPRIIANTQEVINSHDFILSSMYPQTVAIKRQVEFTRLNFFKYENIDVNAEKYVKVRFLFKLSETSESGQLLFHTNLTQGFMSSTVNSDFTFQLVHNFTQETCIHFAHNRLEVNTWYIVEIQLTRISLDVVLSRRDSSAQINASSVNTSSRELTSVDCLFIGGLDREYARANPRMAFYSHNIRMADFTLNHRQMFSSKLAWVII